MRVEKMFVEGKKVGKGCNEGGNRCEGECGDRQDVKREEKGGNEGCKRWGEELFDWDNGTGEGNEG